MKKAFKKIYSFLKSQLVDQKNYVFLSLSLVDFKHSIVKHDENLKIFLANSSHKLKIENDLFPHFDEQQDYFKQFLDFEREDILCYLFAGEYASTRHNLNSVNSLEVIASQL